MIFVTAGSTSFDELMRKVDELKGSGAIEGDVLAQIGSGRYVPKHLRWFRFAEDLSKYIEQADLVITHGGAGTLYEALSLGKRVVAVMNPRAIDNRELPELLHREGLITLCECVEKLEECIRRALSRDFKSYVPPGCRIHEVIIKFLEATKA